MNTLVIRELSVMFQCCEPVIWGPTVFSAPSPIPSPICPVGTGRGDSGSLGLWGPVLRCLPAPLQEPSDPLLLSGSGAGPASEPQRSEALGHHPGPALTSTVNAEKMTPLGDSVSFRI